MVINIETKSVRCFFFSEIRNETQGMDSCMSKYLCALFTSLFSILRVSSHPREIVISHSVESLMYVVAEYSTIVYL